MEIHLASRPSRGIGCSAAYAYLVSVVAAGVVALVWLREGLW